jgi:hypothetical protein
MTTSHSHTPRRLACALAGTALLALGGAAAADANIKLTSPGAMALGGLPTNVRAGEHVTMIEKLPLSIIDGRLLMQRETPTGAWETAASAHTDPWVVWLHWTVPSTWAGSQLAVRFVLESGTQLLSMSPTYSMTVAPR